MNFQSVRTGAAASIMMLMAPFVVANEPSVDGANAPDVSQSKQRVQGYLGVNVSPPHPALAANLNGLLKPGQGLLVDSVAENSPAMQAGVRIHDVLIAYDDQKLFAAEQFAKLANNDQPGRKVNLGLLREGKLISLEATLAKRDPADFRQWVRSPAAEPYRFGRPDHIPRHFTGHPIPAAEWEKFDSLTLKNLGHDRFSAELKCFDQNGKLQKFSFEGTRAELYKAISDAKDINSAERAHLLRSMNMFDPVNPAPLPHIWFEPGLGWFFEQPGGVYH